MLYKVVIRIIEQKILQILNRRANWKQEVSDIRKAIPTIWKTVPLSAASIRSLVQTNKTVYYILNKNIIDNRIKPFRFKSFQNIILMEMYTSEK